MGTAKLKLFWELIMNVDILAVVLFVLLIARWPGPGIVLRIGFVRAR